MALAVNVMLGAVPDCVTFEVVPVLMVILLSAKAFTPKKMINTNVRGIAIAIRPKSRRKEFIVEIP